ncbi:aromatic compound dioxygenase [Aureobasidium pullulans]|uniref:Aromatic compound dioxygenase n=1 Tax=Aureobasidium pullulans TaxID=5580 RepID=A0A4S9UCB1_AURPU|nr:aromatic compound dioxygenase [Aureobasidium pullulans]THZ35067.1 aromatic compound dioxygenase [Aureobasidium pullulans]THZ68116.1 aromatic compound dioxygenase [Aureobasidium pullulans]THZ98273.1 aromatic compound dioxygenase [Aureobasidium pullulans]
MDTVSVPSLKDLTIDNITENVHAINSQCSDQRLKFLLERTVSHLHDLARETRLTTDEWMATLLFLTRVGQISSDVRQEFILLSDVLGLSLLVDSIDHPKPENSTEGTVLGPFHTHEAEHSHNGGSISQDADGEPLLVVCTVKDVDGNPISGVKVDVWETDSKGFYDVQHADRNGPDGRAVLTSDSAGNFWFKAILPVPYPIPHDGPVGGLLKKLNRHPYRPSHMHFMFDKSGYDPLITALYLKNDPYESTDAVFGVKQSLIVEVGKVDDKDQAEKYGVKTGTSLITYDFVLVTDEAARNLRRSKAEEAMNSQGRKVRFIDDLPVPDVD